MEKLLKEIIKGYEEYKGIYSDHRGIGTKSYVTKRIDLLREQLLEMKKELR